jgi:alpha-tubulin suppressor-like RCC1 family protein
MKQITEPLAQVAVGGGHTIALDEAGSVWAWGWNGKGQLGRDGVQESPEAQQLCGLPPCRFVATGHEESFAIDLEGRLWSWGRGQHAPAQTAMALGLGDQRFKHVDGGVFHAAAISEDGRCVAWGKHKGKPGPNVHATGEDSIVFLWQPSDGAVLTQVLMPP